MGQVYLWRISCKDRSSWCKCAQSGIPCCLWICYPGLYSWIPKTGKIEQIVAAHDVGKAVNPLSCEGQIEGGVVMSIGLCPAGKISD